MALLAQVSTQKLITTVIQASSDVLIQDQYNTPGYLTTGFLTLATSSSTETYSFTNNSFVTGNISSLGLAYFSDPGFQTGSLYISTLYLGNVGGSVNGQLTTDDTASDIFWNGTSLTSGGGGGGITTEELISTTAGLGTLDYISSASLASSLISTIESIALGIAETVDNLGSFGYISTLDLTSTVEGLGSIGYMSTLSVTSSINAALSSFSTALGEVGAGGITMIPDNLSTFAFFTSSAVISTATVRILSSFVVNASTAFVNQPFFDTVNIGSVSTINSLEFYGLFGNYNNTVLAEISTGAGTQELLMFKGSSTSDRVRVQTTGNFVVETGVSARLFNSNTIQTLSNAIPAFIINTSSNVGIQTASPGTALDVAGTGRFVTLSSLTLFASSIVAPYVFQPQFFTF